MVAYRKNLKRGDTCEDCGCPENPCDPCFTCPTPTLKCESVAVTKSKEYCGYLNPADGKYYLTKTVKVDQDYTDTSAFSGGCGTGTIFIDYHIHTTTTYTINRTTCEETVTYSGGNSRERKQTLDSNGVVIEHRVCSASISSTGEISGSQTITQKECDGTDAGTETTPITALCTGGGVESPIITTTYSDEEVRSTAELIGDAMAALPAFPGTWAGGCESAYDLSEDERTISLTHAQVKFTLADNLPSNQRMTIPYRILWTPEEGATVETEATTTIAPEEKESAVIDLPVPSSNGVLAISTFEAVCETV